jgi:hypothetical protein
MKVQLRRWFAIGLIGASIVTGGVAVAAAPASDAASVNVSRELREEITATTVTTDRVVTIVPSSIAFPSVGQDVLNSRDSR